MKIVSTNLAQLRTVLWKDRPIQTGIFKYPVAGPLFLGKEDVDKDHVIDRRYHGGVDKACYLYSADHYDFWKMKYPNLDWDYGMFGENLTVQGLQEASMHIGDVYQLGTALVQVSQPRQPCFKLGIRFSDQGVLKQFIGSGYPGAYLRIAKEGEVREGDEMILQARREEALSLQEVFHLLYAPNPDPARLAVALDDEALAEAAKRQLKRKAEHLLG